MTALHFVEGSFLTSPSGERGVVRALIKDVGVLVDMEGFSGKLQPSIHTSLDQVLGKFVQNWFPTSILFTLPLTTEDINNFF